ncbi:Uncharacterised protein [Vibrio cholerae]|nr:Uncharacterised protein [Vibrio cholerae]CSI35699.1 Uncharacterised protein [Vibrio cholerae]
MQKVHLTTAHNFTQYRFTDHTIFTLTNKGFDG